MRGIWSGGNWKTLKLGKTGAVAAPMLSAAATGAGAAAAGGAVADGAAGGACAEAGMRLKARREARVRENGVPRAKAHFFDGAFIVGRNAGAISEGGATVSEGRA